MKRKIFLTVFMVAALVCILAISISAANYSLGYDRVYTIGGVEYPLWEQDAEGNYHPLMWYQNGDTLCKVYADNTDSSKAPYVTYSAYTSGSSRELQNFNITDENGNTFNGKGTVVIANLNGIFLKAGDTNGITHIHKNAFMGSTVLKAVYIPASIVFLGFGSNNNLVPFEGCTALEYAEFDSNCTIKTLSPNTFYGCTSLKAISLPDSIESLTHSTFLGCTSLKAVYLPSNLTTFQPNKWNTGAFYNCANVYFVNEPFTLNSVDDSAIPAKPEVYYFPSGLSSFGDFMRGCKSINNVLIFGENLVTVDTSAFADTGLSGEEKTMVFLGNMEKFNLGEGIGYKINFVFPNATDSSAFTARTDRGFGGSYGYLCQLDKKVKFHYGATIEEGTQHFVEASKTNKVEATCITNEILTTKCYCNTVIGTVETENSALGHNFDLENGASVVDIVYADFTKNGNKVILCGRENCGCHDTEVEGQQLVEVAPVISGFNGYSIKLDGNGITFGFNMNIDALNEYELYNAKVEIGTVVAVKGYLNGQNPIDAEGNPVALEKGNVIKAQATDKGNIYTRVDFILKGDMWDSSIVINEETVALKDLEFVMCPYVICDGVVSYISTQGSVENANDIVAVYSQLQVEEAPIEE